MAYEKQTWNCGDTITATKLNNIERGLGDMDEEYTPTEWSCGDTITAEKLNKIENELAYLSENCGGGSSDFSTAEVTLITTTEEQTTNSFANVTDIEGTNELFTESYFGTTEEPVITQAVLYQGACTMASFSPLVTDASHINIVGDATPQFGPFGLQYILITGDCTITIS